MRSRCRGDGVDTLGDGVMAASSHEDAIAAMLNSDAAAHEKIRGICGRSYFKPQLGSSCHFLDELVGRDHTLKVVPRPYFPQQRAELPHERCRVLVVSGVQEKVPQRPHVRQLVHDDIYIIRFFQIIQAAEARQVSYSMDISRERRHLI